MEKYHLLIEINKKLSSGEDISVPEKENAVAVFLKGICPEDREWIDKLRAPLGEFISDKEKGEAAVRHDVPMSYLPMAFADINYEKIVE